MHNSARLDYHLPARWNMHMQVDLKTYVDRNFKSSSLSLVYFELLANALDAGAENVSIDIKYEDGKPESLEVTMTDDGEGIDDEGFGRFCVLLQGRDFAHKGVGRIVTLPYFENVIYVSQSGGRRREFRFTYDFQPGDCVVNDVTEAPYKNGTTVKMSGYKKAKIWTGDYVDAHSIKQKLINHFIVRLFEMAQKKPNFRIEITVNGGAPFLSEVISRNDIKDLTEDFFEVPGYSSAKVFYSFVHGLPDARKHAELTAVVDTRCAKFPSDIVGVVLLPDGTSLNLFIDWPGFSVDEIRNISEISDDRSRAPFAAALREYLRKLLRRTFPEIDQKNADAVKEICYEHPSLVGYVSDNEVGLVDQPSALKSAREQYLKVEDELKHRARIGAAKPREIERFQQRALAEYVQHRQRIIDCLAALEPGSKEKEAHNLIFKMKEILSSETKSNVLPNLWLIDERFMSYSSAFSDVDLKKIAGILHGSNEPGTDDARDRPDILLSFNSSEAKSSEVEMVIVELKKRFGTDAENVTALLQLKQRAAQVMRTFPMVKRAWYYGLVEMDKDTILFLRQVNFTQLFSSGNVLYKFEEIPLDETANKYPVMITFLDYSGLIDDARARNQTFLRVLKDGFRRSVKDGDLMPG